VKLNVKVRRCFGEKRAEIEKRKVLKKKIGEYECFLVLQWRG